MKKLRFKMTCSACPEQYDVFWGDQRVGYFRLRWGSLRVDCPDCGGETVYETEVGEEGDCFTGCFDDQAQRDHHLRHAAAAILAWLDRNQPELPGLEELRIDYDSAPNVPYELEDFHPWE